MERIYNFSAGPSMLPVSALERASQEMLNYRGSGMSVMEMSHRSKVYLEIFQDTKDKFRSALAIPEDYEILFLQTGATGQFSMIPLNLMGEKATAHYAVTGNFSGLAAKEAEKYGTVHRVVDTSGTNHTTIPGQSDIQTPGEASYFYYCSNNTIYGTQWSYVPQVSSPLVCDMSSDILSRPVDVKKFDLIMAGAQKNMAPAGLTVVILKKDISLAPHPLTPVMMDYKLMMDKDSMYNTPPCYNIYMLGLTLDWVAEQGGVVAMEKRTRERADGLYQVLDDSRLFTAPAEVSARSAMNVVFRTESPELDDKFVKEAKALGFENLKGHRNVGGMRASIYNAFPTEGVEKLMDFIREFDKNN